MNKFEKAQQILQEINSDGWLIVCNEDNDIHSRYLLGVASHAIHAIFRLKYSEDSINQSGNLKSSISPIPRKEGRV